MKKIILIILTAVISTSSCVGILLKTAHADAFNQNDIMDNAVFDDANSMTQAQIQSFLNAFPNSCLSNYSAPYPSDYFTYGANAPASAIIKQVSNLWGINPKVILTTLEKEESLVTGNAGCDSWRYNSAVGMGCSDTGPCPSAGYAGFSQQVTKGMWQLMFNRERSEGNLAWGDNGSIYYGGFMTPGTYSRQSGSPATYYDGIATIDGSPVTMSNGATAALYTYTPHFAGNQNFQAIFNQWFGSTHFPQPIGGSLYYQQSTGALFLVNDTTRYYIPSFDILRNYGLDVYPSMSASDATIQSFTDGGALTDLTWDSNGVYLVNNKVRYHVSTTMCTAWGFACTDNTQVKPLNSTFQTQYLQQGFELANLVYSNGNIYRMDAGSKEPIANPRTLSDLGLGSTAILATSPANSLQPLGVLLMTTPGMIQFSASSPIYYFDGTTYYQIPDMNSYNDWGLRAVSQLSAPQSLYTTTPPPSSSLSSWITSGGVDYIIDHGSKIQIPSSLQSLWSGASFSTQIPTPLFNSLSSATLSNFIWTNPDMYYIDSAGKHHVPTYADAQALQSQLGSPQNISFNKVSSISTGNDYLAEGKIVNVQDGSGKLYVVNNRKLTYIPNPDIFNAYGYNWGSIASYPTSIETDYPTDGLTLTNGISSDGTHFIHGPSSLLYQLSGSMAADFGTIDSNFMAVDKQAIGRQVPTLSRFLYNVDNGNIYYASGGAIHYVATQNAYQAYGGTLGTPSAVNTQTLSLFTQAQALY